MKPPGKLDTTSNSQSWFNRLREFALSLVIVNSRDILVERTPRGQVLHIREKTRGGTTGGLPVWL